jgi:hypothetical protein
MHVYFTELDRSFLRQMGSVGENSFIDIIEPDPDNDDNLEQPELIRHSPYHDFNKLLSTLKNCKNQFSIFSTNIQSIHAKIDELRIFVECLKMHNYAFSAICIQESWLSDDADTSQIQLDGYKCIPQGKSCSSKGGLIIYLDNQFDYHVKSKLTKYKTWEGQIIQVKKGKSLSKAINIGNIYRPPKELLVNYYELINEFSPILDTLENNNNEVMITGDFNIDLLKINNKHVISEYFDMLTSHSFYPKITLPTRLSNKHGTLIDNIFCKLTEATLNTTSGILTKKFSDHQPYFTILNNVLYKDSPPVFVNINKNDQESINNFCNELLSSNELTHLPDTLSLDPNINYNILHDVIQYAKQIHMPSKLVKFKKYKHKKSNWISHGIIKSIQYRDDLYKKHKMTDPNSTQHAIQKINLSTYNNILKKSIRISKKKYYQSLFSKFINDIKSTWKTISELLNKTKRKKSLSHFFRDGDQVITDKLTIANKFNTFFTNIGSTLSNQISVSNNNFKHYLTKEHKNIFTFRNVNEDTVSQIIDKISPKASFGFDGLSSKLIKTVKNALIKPITLIINQMLNTGIFPDKLKIAKIMPIHKKDDETLFTNYRPISLLPAISKIFEKVIFKQIYKFFQDKKLFFNAQYGFRFEHCTEFAALDLVDKVMLEMDKMNTPINIFLDLSKAFDTLDHKILIQKLEYYGIKGTALKLMESYLTNRKQYVEIHDTKSDILTLTTGVPQGSILGPLLFIIYINDIAQASKLFDFIIYADDTTLSTTLETVVNKDNASNSDINLNIELANVSNWLCANKLSLNVAKCKYIIFHTPKKKVKPLSLKINNTVIERVKEFNFLGLTINEHLNWKAHINKIANKISKSLGILNKLKHFLPLHTKVLMYNSLILSYLNFGILAWGYECNRITKLQKKAIRIISISKYNAHTEPIFKALKLLKVNDILRVQQLKFYYKFKNNKLPHNLQLFPINHNTDFHNYTTRAQHHIHPVRTRHEYAKKCIRYHLPKVINDTPAIILDKIDTHSLKGFANYIKFSILQSYQQTCLIVNCYICNRN